MTVIPIHEKKKKTTLCPVSVFVDSQVSDRCPWANCFARDEMRKRHFIDKNNDKTSKTMTNANCDVNIGSKVKMPNSLHAGLPDVDLIICNEDQLALLTYVPSHAALKLVNGMLKFTVTKNEQLTSCKLLDVSHLC